MNKQANSKQIEADQLQGEEQAFKLDKQNNISNSSSIDPRVLDLLKQLKTDDPYAIIQFGVPPQTKLANLSQTIIDHVQKKGTDPIRNVVDELIQKLKLVNIEELNPKSKNLFNFLFRKFSSSVNETMSKYQQLGAQIDRIAAHLKYQVKTLLTDNQVLETLYQQNNDYFNELNIYIDAIEIKLSEIQGQDIPELKIKLKASENELIQQNLDNLIQISNSLEKRLYDLRLSRQITLQNGPQLRLLQNANNSLIEIIQSSILTSIPIWRNQIGLSLTLLRQKQAIDTKQQVKAVDRRIQNSLTINDQQNSADIETLKETQNNLINISLETIRIEHEGDINRKQVEHEFVKIDDQLKETLKQY